MGSNGTWRLCQENERRPRSSNENATRRRGKIIVLIMSCVYFAVKCENTSLNVKGRENLDWLVAARFRSIDYKICLEILGILGSV